jgi:hypothetical protein
MYRISWCAYVPGVSVCLCLCCGVCLHIARVVFVLKGGSQFGRDLCLEVVDD